MALIGFEGFEDILASGVVSNKVFGTGIENACTANFTSTGNQKQASPFGGSMLGAANTTTNTVNLATALTTQNCFVGQRWRCSTNPNTANPALLEFRDGATIQVGLSINASSKLIVWRGTTANILGTGTTTIFASSYYYVEMSCLVHPSAGTFELKLNGVSEIALTTGQNTRNSATSQINTINFPMFQTQQTTIDDIYVCDDTGGAPLNTFLGICRIETPTANSADSTTWTPNASTNVSRINEASPDDDTTYNFTSTTNTDTYNHTALTSTPATIFAVAVSSRVRKDDVTNKSYRNKLKSGATTSSGGTVSIATSYQYVKDIFITDPNTGVAWTQPNTDATKIGYEHI